MKDRKSYEYQKWRKEVLERDRYRCRLCGKSSEDTILNVHHINKYSENEELRTDINNGITLCLICHSNIFNKEEEYIDLFKDLIKQSIETDNEVRQTELRKLTLKNIAHVDALDSDSITKICNTMFKAIPNGNAFKVYCYLCYRYNNNYQYAFPSISTIANDTCLSESTVKRSLNWLKEQKFIVVYKKHGSEWMNNCYYVRYVESSEIEEIKLEQSIVKLLEEELGSNFEEEIEITVDKDGNIIKDDEDN